MKSVIAGKVIATVAAAAIVVGGGTAAVYTGLLPIGQEKTDPAAIVESSMLPTEAPQPTVVVEESAEASVESTEPVQQEETIAAEILLTLYAMQGEQPAESLTYEEFLKQTLAGSVKPLPVSAEDLLAYEPVFAAYREYLMADDARRVELTNGSFGMEPPGSPVRFWNYDGDYFPLRFVVVHVAWI